MKIEELDKLVSNKVSISEFFIKIKPEIVQFQSTQKGKKSVIPIKVEGDLDYPLSISAKFTKVLVDYLSPDLANKYLVAYICDTFLMLGNVQFENEKVEETIAILADEYFVENLSTRDLKLLRF